MATVDTLIKRALRLIRVQDATESVSSENAVTAIQVLNDMMARWTEDGASVGWSTVSSVADTVPAPDSALKAIAYNLAVDLAPEFEMEPSAPVMMGASEGYADILRDSLKFTLEPSSTDHLPASRAGRYNINSDS